MPKETNTKSNEITMRIEELILDGSLKVKEKIPSERQLCARLNASRTSIREAMKELRGRGVIKTIHGKGSFVTDVLGQQEEQSSLYKLYNSHPRTLYDLLEVRENLEGQAARLAAERASEKDLYNITKAFNAMNNAFNDKTDVLEAATLDHNFHRSIYEASQNPILIHTLHGLIKLMHNSVVVTISNLYHNDRSKHQIEAYHRLIYNAIMDRKPAKAERAAKEHIKDVRDRIREIEKQQEQELIRAKLLSE